MLTRPTLTLLASLLVGLLATPLAALAAADENLLAAARAAQPAVVESLKAMVAIESGTMDAPGLGPSPTTPRAGSRRWACRSSAAPRPPARASCWWPAPQAAAAAS